MHVLLRPKTLLGYMIPRHMVVGCSGAGNPDEAAPALDFPEQSIPYAQGEREMPEHEREPPNTSTVHANGATTEVPDDESKQQKSKGRPRNGGIQFAGGAQHDRGRGAKGKAPARANGHREEHRHEQRQDARHRHRSPYPTREPKKAMPIPIPIPISVPVSHKKDVPVDIVDIARDVARVQEDTASWEDGTDDAAEDNNGDNDVGNHRDATMEKNPLATYPPIGRSLEHRKRRVGPARAQTSQLTEGIRRYTQLCEKDAVFVARVKEITERQSKPSPKWRNKLKALQEEAKKTIIPFCRKDDVPNWGFEMAVPGCDGTTVFGELVLPVYRDAPSHSRE
ncbi:hypothetical protein F4803DRAFT_544067 [Xylaria telfairii]|nr:hypothetical protein F4803DRAFT_544067 [Xylaria telfairii]